MSSFSICSCGCVGPRGHLLSLLSVVSLLFLSSVPFVSSAGFINATVKALERGYHGIRNSEAVETLHNRAEELVTRKTPTSPPLKVLSAELDGLGLGAACLLEHATTQGSAQGTYLLAVAAKSDAVRSFSRRFRCVGNGSFKQAGQDVAKHLELLSGAIPIPATATNSPFLVAEVSAIRPSIFALSQAYATAIERGDQRFIADFIRASLPKMRQLLKMVLTLMEATKTKEVERKRQSLSNWIGHWFQQDLALLEACPGADAKEITVRQVMAMQHHELSGGGV